MQKIISAHMSSKSQVTIPKEARQVLGIDGGSMPIGFIIDAETHTVKLTRVDITPVDEDFTEEEYRKLTKLADGPGGKTFKTAKSFLKHIKKL